MSDYRNEFSDATMRDDSISESAACRILVIGVGGGGGNSVQYMVDNGLKGVEFIAVNTDAQVLKKSTIEVKAQIGVKITAGLGAGCDPNVGRNAAEESREDLKKIIQGADLIFITAGMGGGTGTGASPIIAELAKESGALTIAVVTKPFTFEGKRHLVNAASGIAELAKNVDSLIVVENDKLLKNLPGNITLKNAFSASNDVLFNAVRGITDTLNASGFINVDFADIRTIMRDRGHAIIGTGYASGANGANYVEEAVEKAIHSPLIDTVDIQSAKGIIANFRVNSNFSITKLSEVSSAIQSYAAEEADCKFGIVYDDSIDEEAIAVTILITGINGDNNGSSNTQVNRPMQASQNQAAPQKTVLGNQRPQVEPQGVNKTGFFDNVLKSENAPYPQSAPRHEAPAFNPQLNTQNQGFNPQPQQRPSEGFSFGQERREPGFNGSSIGSEMNQAPDFNQQSQEAQNQSQSWKNFMPRILRSKSE